MHKYTKYIVAATLEAVISTTVLNPNTYKMLDTMHPATPVIIGSTIILIAGIWVWSKIEKYLEGKKAEEEVKKEKAYATSKRIYDLEISVTNLNSIVESLRKN